jgi:adenylate cyclase
MGVEIERKFLVAGPFPREGGGIRLTQGYLSSVPERTVRVRMASQQAVLTVKGPGDDTGTTRFEWEIAIPKQDAESLLRLCEPGVIDKVRYRIPVGRHTFEVDEFHGENEGLVLAEIELADPNEPFERPPWLGTEVTGDPRYYNAMLMKHPFARW